MKHSMITIRLPADMHEAYRSLSLDGRRQALENMREALRSTCAVKPNAPKTKENVAAAPVERPQAPEPPKEDAPMVSIGTQEQVKPAVQDIPVPTQEPETQAGIAPEPGPEPELENPFPDLIKSLAEGW